LLVGLVLAFLCGLFLARRMVRPIQALRAGAAHIASGDLGQRISIKTGDELGSGTMNTCPSTNDRRPNDGWRAPRPPCLRVLSFDPHRVLREPAR
jgi:hypothetical protein